MSDRQFDIPSKIKSLTQDLLWMSESDYPFDTFTWSNQDLNQVDIQSILQKTNHPLDTPVRMINMEQFFRQATAEEDWYDDEERETAKKYQALVETLKHNLENIQVYKVGQVELDVYIIGQTELGDWVGLSTKAVES